MAGDKDPIEVITERARALVVDAMDAGWRGPPFDPFALAEFQKLRIVGNERVRDARILPVGVDDFIIEFNPNRPVARVRYSLAHEIAHTLFADCGDQVRNRSAHHEIKGNEWQLEALCNIAASEILMPVGTLPHFSGDDLNIERLDELRREYQVSAEALFIRVARLADEPCLAFCATRIEEGKDSGRYRLDYTIPSESWTGPLPRSLLLPENTRLAECVGIGFTAKAVETWPGEIGTIYAEALGISPYPGAKFPRVVGVLRSDDIVAGESCLTYLSGDATMPRGAGPKIITHVVNDAVPRWGAGFPLAIKKRWQQVQEEFITWVTEDRRRLRLGHVHEVRVAKDCSIIHMVAQHGYGASSTPRIRYSALRSCLQQVVERAKIQGASVHMPRIGAGQAGGHWPLIEELIRSTLCKAEVPVFVYDLPGRSLPKQTQFELTI
jgi:O-acetyl-ADP-ribose deacetylase (regulator of RNase III)